MGISSGHGFRGERSASFDVAAPQLHGSMTMLLQTPRLETPLTHDHPASTKLERRAVNRGERMRPAPDPHEA
jgi:hypothetical protein